MPAERKKRPAGRPTDYTADLTDEICERLSDGESLRSICRDDKMPTAKTIYSWMRKYDSFLTQYAIAKEESADAHVEDMLDIADNETSLPVMDNGLPVLVDGKPLMTTDSAAVARARLMVDTRKWAASKLKPKKYGEKLELAGTIGLTDLSEDQLDDKINQLRSEIEQSSKN